MKLDEKILEEIRKEEDAEKEELRIKSADIAEDAMESDVDNSEDLGPDELDDALKGPLGDVLSESSDEEIIEAHDSDESGTLDRVEIEDAVQETQTRQANLLDGEWGDS
jgi:hypothetical protein